MSRMTLRTALIVAACLAPLLSSSNLGAQHADPARRAAFAGTWRLDLKKSFMGQDHPDPDYAFTKTLELKGSAIVQKDHEVNVDIIGMALPERNSEQELTPDGQEHTIQVPGFFPGAPPTPTQVVAQWQGDNLLVSESAQTFIGPMNTSRRYFLSDDGSELVELITSSMTYGDSEQRLVFARAIDSH